jgi:cysteinyl-tRNA synthetase
MELRLYDTYTRSLRAFVPLRHGEAGIYACGPTVYDFAHIGNLRTYLFEDGLKRVLQWNGYRIRHVMNITDVGHLTSDADTGPDKMDEGARRSGRSAWEIAEQYTEAFRKDLASLNIAEPDVWCRATEHIVDQIAFVQDLEVKGFTYRTRDGIYFDTSKLKGYGHLGRLDAKGQRAGIRVDLGDKRNPTDFALWKFSPLDQVRQMEWESPWGLGFPGWHIECSAMAQRYLGDLFDLHCGGEDHIKVHHTNEIAQTEARCGTRLANYWLHGYFLQLDQAKMSKSSGGFLRLQTLQDRGYDPLAFRYLCLTAHYRTHLVFTWEALEGASTALDRLRFVAAGDPDEGVPDGDLTCRFTEAINEDLNFPRALAVAWEVAKGGLPAPVKRATLQAFDRVLGLDVTRRREQPVPEEVWGLAQARREARLHKDFTEADRLREAIRLLGWRVEDAPEGFVVKPWKS